VPDVYTAVRVSEPTASEPAGMVMVAEPEVSAIALEANEPVEMETDPVGVPVEPETAIVTLRLCAVVMLVEAGVTTTAGVEGPAGEPLLALLPPQPVTMDAAQRKPMSKRVVDRTFKEAGEQVWRRRPG
jgi:hypothetical protein